MQMDINGNKGLSARLALYLSAFVFPGAGQMAQKRWLAGTLYALAFAGCTVFLMLAVFVPMITNMRLALDFAARGDAVVFRKISFAQIFIWLGLGVLIYVAGLLDTFIYHNRMQSHARMESALEANASGGGPGR